MSIAADPYTEKKPLPESPGAGGDGEAPLKVIQRRSGWQFVDLGELWRFRELLFFLTWRDVKVRYKQTALGAAWAVLQPLATMLAFSLFLGRVASSPDATVAYPLFVFAGLLPWMFFSAAVNSAGNSVTANERLVTKIYFPRLLVPLSAVLAATLDFVIAFVLLLILQPFFGVVPGLGLLAAPGIMLLVAALTVGLGSLLAALTVAYRDFRVIVPLTLQLWMFATPAIFLQDLSVLGPRMNSLLLVNPLHGVVVNFRAATLDGAYDAPALGVTALWAVAALLIGCFYFRRVERGFADII
jgi:lipopolysaccharide transport system permease protein